MRPKGKSKIDHKDEVANKNVVGATDVLVTGGHYSPGHHSFSQAKQNPDNT